MFNDIYGYLTTRSLKLLRINEDALKKSTNSERVLLCIIALPMIGLIFSILHLLIPCIVTINHDAAFRKLPEVDHVNCARLFQGDSKYMKEISSRRPHITDRASGMSTCGEIRSKIYPPRNPDTSFPILFARLVYKDYTFLEEQLVANYASENVYCYLIDHKAPKIFHDRIRKLEECVPNLMIVKKQLELDSAGHNQNEAHLECMRIAMDRKWEYVVLMQNHDIIIKTHAEITEILKIYGGANDVNVETCRDYFCPASWEMNLGKLNLCPKDFTGTRRTICEASKIRWGKGVMQATISRAASEFILTNLNTTTLIKQLNDRDYAVDEQFFPTLQITTLLDLPGGFHPKCMETASQFVTRVARVAWALPANPPHNWCASGKIRHDACIYGIEHLPELATLKQIMANKMLPYFDYAVVSCVSEMLYNRTRIAPNINREYYENINMVRYHRERKLPGFDIDEFKCEL